MKSPFTRYCGEDAMKSMHHDNYQDRYPRATATGMDVARHETPMEFALPNQV